MDNCTNLNVITKAYDFLDRLTPLKTDCGKLCSGKCCKGESKDGMLLFPGEEIIFKNRDGFEIYYDSRYNCKAIICHGICDRRYRPLSCRIFPYLIYLNSADGKPTVAPDIRAVDFCPVLREGYKLDKKFLRALRITGRLLISDPGICDFLVQLTKSLTDFNNL